MGSSAKPNNPFRIWDMGISSDKGIYRNESLDAKSQYWFCYKADLNPSSTSAESTASCNEEYMR
jgi:hypothetical protein